MKSEDCEPFDYFVVMYGGHVVWYQKTHKKGVLLDDQLTELQIKSAYMEFEKDEQDTKGSIGSDSKNTRKKERNSKERRKD